jgi:hypothetical protein
MFICLPKRGGGCVLGSDCLGKSGVGKGFQQRLLAMPVEATEQPLVDCKLAKPSEKRELGGHDECLSPTFRPVL